MSRFNDSYSKARLNVCRPRKESKAAAPSKASNSRSNQQPSALVFNSLSWPRAELVELPKALKPNNGIVTQDIGNDKILGALFEFAVMRKGSRLDFVVVVSASLFVLALGGALLRVVCNCLLLCSLRVCHALLALGFCLWSAAHVLADALGFNALFGATQPQSRWGSTAAATVDGREMQQVEIAESSEDSGALADMDVDESSSSAASSSASAASSKTKSSSKKGAKAGKADGKAAERKASSSSAKTRVFRLKNDFLIVEVR